MTESKGSIKALRQILGISQKELAEKVGVDRRTVGMWETCHQPQKRYASKLQEIFDDCPKNPEASPPQSTAPKIDYEDTIAKRVAENLRAIQRKFIVGKCYAITDSKNPSEGVILQQPVLRYERKDGIHHVFRAVRGKWITTYTDAQLVGRYVKEVEDLGNGTS